MPRFAVLRHDSPRGQHWDFLLEMGQVLRTWALPEPPTAGAEMTCEALADHRLTYLDYEGEVSGGRGWVTRWDSGNYEMECQLEERLVLVLMGERLRGPVMLQRCGEAPLRWRFSLARP